MNTRLNVRPGHVAGAVMLASIVGLVSISCHPKSSTTPADAEPQSVSETLIDAVLLPSEQRNAGSVIAEQVQALRHEVEVLRKRLDSLETITRDLERVTPGPSESDADYFLEFMQNETSSISTTSPEMLEQQLEQGEEQRIRSIEQIEQTLRKEAPNMAWSTLAEDQLTIRMKELGYGVTPLVWADCRNTLCKMNIQFEDDPIQYEALRKMGQLMPLESEVLVHVDSVNNEVTLYMSRDGEANHLSEAEQIH